MRAHSTLHLPPQASQSSLHPVPWLVSPRAGGSGLSLAACEIGVALGEEGWEASGSWREVQIVCTPESFHGDHFVLCSSLSSLVFPTV